MSAIGGLPGRSPGPRPVTPNRGYNGSGIGNYGQQNPPQGNITIPRGEFTPGSPNNPLLNMSLDPNAGSTGGINGGGMMGPRPMMIR